MRLQSNAKFMSHHKPPVSHRDSQPIYLQFGKYQNDEIRYEESRNRNKTSKESRTKRNNASLSSISSGKRCHSTPAKLYNSQHRKHSRVSTHERQIITQKLQEIDDLRAKILELQWVLSSHQDMCSQSMQKKSSCFACLQRSSNSKVDIDYSKMTLDQMSTEVVFNSSRESLPKLCTEVAKVKRYRKRKKCKKKKRVCEKKSQTMQTGSKQETNPHKQPKITNTNTIVLPELYSSNKSSSSEEIMQLAEKIQAQNSEITQIKISLQECLDLLRNKQKEESRSEYLIEQPSANSKSKWDECIYLNYMQQRKNNTLPTEVFTCSTYDDRFYTYVPPPPKPEPCGFIDCAEVARPSALLTVRKAETCQDKKKEKKKSGCCAKKSQSQDRRVVIVRTPTKSTVACTNTSCTDLCDNFLDSCYDNEYKVPKKFSPLPLRYYPKEHKIVSSDCCLPKFIETHRKSNTNGICLLLLFYLYYYTEGKKQTQTKHEKEKKPVVSTQTEQAHPHIEVLGREDKERHNEKGRHEETEHHKDKNRHEERGHHKDKDRHKEREHRKEKGHCSSSGTQSHRRPNPCHCPDRRRKNVFMRCLLCMFCRNL